MLCLDNCCADGLATERAHDGAFLLHVEYHDGHGVVLAQCRCRGIRVVLDGDRVTTKVVHPVPNGEGKVENVREFVLARPHGVAVAAFGNSYSTDGAFLRYVATQPSLPGGAKGTAVMINGGKTVPGYTEHFITVDQEEVVGK